MFGGGRTKTIWNSYYDTIYQSVAYVMSGMYGGVRILYVFNAIFVILHVFILIAGTIVIALAELLQKGYGLGSGIALRGSRYIDIYIKDTNI